MKLSTLNISLLWIIIWEICFVVAMSLAKTLDKNISSITLLFLRSLFGFIFLLPLLIKKNISSLKTKHLFLHIMRVILLSGTIFCTYYSYRNLPMATAAAISFTSSLITPFLASIFLKEKISPIKWTLIFFGYLGILIFLDPSPFLNETMCVAFLGSLLASIVVICMKKLSSIESTFTMLFYGQAACMIISFIVVIPVWQVPSQNATLKMCLIGFFAILSQFCYIKALKNGKPSFLAPFEYTRIITSSIIGWLIFNEIPTYKGTIGTFIIIISTFWMYLIELNKSKVNL